MQERFTINLACSCVYCNDVFNNGICDRRADTALEVAAHSERKSHLPVDCNPTRDEHESHDDIADGHRHSEDAHKRLPRY